MKKIIISLVICILLLSGCKKKPNNPEVEEKIISVSITDYCMTYETNKGGVFTSPVIDENIDVKFYNIYVEFYPNYTKSFAEWIKEYGKPVIVSIVTVEIVGSTLKVTNSLNEVLVEEITLSNYLDLYKTYKQYLNVDSPEALIDKVLDVEEDDLSFSYSLLSDGTYALTGYTGNETSITLPLYYKNQRVTKVESNAFKRSTLTNIVVPFTYVEICDKAFYFAMKLQKIEILNDNCKIGNEAFCFCTALEEVKLPKNIKILSSALFKECHKLSKINFNDLSSLETIKDQVFMNCGSLNNVFLHDSLTTINNNAFYACASLETIDIPNFVTTIDDLAFYGCTSLRNVTLGKALETLGSGVFSSCTLLENIEFPNSLIKIGGNCFESCNSITEVVFPSSLRVVESAVYNSCLNLEKVVLNEGLTSLGSSMFINCKKLKDITFSSTIDRMGLSCFSGCIGLVEVVLPEGLSRVYDSNFNGCTNLTKINIPSTVTFIGGSAFANCRSLKEIIIPDSVTEMVANAFNNCVSLQTIKVPYIGLKKNDGNSLSAILGFVPSTLTTVILGDELDEIKGNAFNNCQNVTTLVIGLNVSTIDVYAINNLNSNAKLLYHGTIMPKFNFIGDGSSLNVLLYDDNASPNTWCYLDNKIVLN